MTKLELLKFAANNGIDIIQHKLVDQVSSLNGAEIAFCTNDDDLGNQIWDQNMLLGVPKDNKVYNITVNKNHGTVDMHNLHDVFIKYNDKAACNLTIHNPSEDDYQKAHYVVFNNVNEKEMYDILNILAKPTLIKQRGKSLCYFY